MNVKLNPHRDCSTLSLPALFRRNRDDEIPPVSVRRTSHRDLRQVLFYVPFSSPCARGREGHLGAYHGSKNSGKSGKVCAGVSTYVRTHQNLFRILKLIVDYSHSLFRNSKRLLQKEPKTNFLCTSTLLLEPLITLQLIRTSQEESGVDTSYERSIQKQHKTADDSHSNTQAGTTATTLGAST